MFKQLRKGSETIESLILIAIMGGVAVTVLAAIAYSMSGEASAHAVPILQSVQFSRWLN